MRYVFRPSDAIKKTVGIFVAVTEGRRTRIGWIARVDHDHYLVRFHDGAAARYLHERCEAIDPQPALR